MRKGEALGYALGLAAVALFALTLPATRVAVRELDPVFVGAGRAALAAIPAAAYLLLTRAAFPSREHLARLAVISAGCVVGFPLLISWAMQRVDASHGGVVLGILPLATAVAAARFPSARPAPGFWALAALGAALVSGYSLGRAGGTPAAADLALLLAVACSALGYAEGARLSREMGGLRVISWALVLAAPLLALPALLLAPASSPSPQAWSAFAYVAFVSQWLGFVPWYKGLALGGVARVSQTQLLQPFLTAAASGWLLSEPADAATWAVAALVAAVVATAAFSGDRGARAPRAARARPG